MNNVKAFKNKAGYKITVASVLVSGLKSLMGSLCDTQKEKNL